MLENLTVNDEVARTLAARYLLPQETDIIAVRQHPAVLGCPVLGLAIAVVAAAGLTVWPAPGQIPGLAWAACGLLGAGLAYQVASWTLRWTVVTAERVLLISGRKATNLPLYKGQRLAVRHTFCGRFLGYGTLSFESMHSQLETVTVQYVPRAEELYREITALAFPEKRGR